LNIRKREEGHDFYKNNHKNHQSIDHQEKNYSAKDVNNHQLTNNDGDFSKISNKSQNSFQPIQFLSDDMMIQTSKDNFDLQECIEHYADSFKKKKPEAYDEFLLKYNLKKFNKAPYSTKSTSKKLNQTEIKPQTSYKSFSTSSNPKIKTEKRTSIKWDPLE